MTLNASRVRLGGQPSCARSTAARVPWALMVTAAGGVALGALLAHFFDPKSGRRRRHTGRDRAIARLRRTERRAARRARRTEAHAVGVVRRTVNARRTTREPLDDVTLAHKVETQLFRRADVPKGQVDINAEEGVVFLRGVVERPEDMRRIEALARQLPDVRSVENLLHLPGTPAPASRPKLLRERDDNGGRR